MFCEACSPLPMGEGLGVRSGLGEGFCFWLGLFVGLSGAFMLLSILHSFCSVGDKTNDALWT